MHPVVTEANINDFKTIVHEWALVAEGMVLENKWAINQKPDFAVQIQVNELLLKNKGICLGFLRYCKENNRGFKDFIYSFQKGGTNGIAGVSEEMIDRIYDLFVPLTRDIHNIPDIFTLVPTKRIEPLSDVL
jgi:hypothetical protein